MSDAIILEFTGVDADAYHAVNKLLGIDQATGEGDWPDGLISHTGATSAEGLLVFEVWDAQATQAEFMNSRLGPALGQAGLPQPSRAEWLTVIGHHGS